MTVNNPPEKLSPGGELPGTERRRYGVNNPVGNIPIETPMLKRIWKAAMDAFFGMTQEEKEALNKEIKEVTDTNCSHDIKDIADMLADTTEKFCKDYPFY